MAGGDDSWVTPISAAKDTYDRYALRFGPIHHIGVAGPQTIIRQGKSTKPIIAVHVNDPAVSDYTDISQVPRHTFREIRRFFQDYKALENKEVTVEQFAGAEEALEVVRESLALYRAEETRLRGW